MKTFKLNRQFLPILALLFLVVSCSKKGSPEPDDPQIEDNSEVPAVNELSMLIDGVKWEAKYIKYPSSIVGLEPGEIFEQELLHLFVAYNKTKAELDQIAEGNKSDEDVESISMSLVIPASRAHSPTGIYKFNEQSEQSQNAIKFHSNTNGTYSNLYNINPNPGAINVIKQSYGDRGSVNGIKLGYGLNNFEGTFEFELNGSQGTPESKSIKITEGKFKIRPFN